MDVNRTAQMLGVVLTGVLTTESGNGAHALTNPVSNPFWRLRAPVSDAEGAPQALTFLS